LALSDRDTVSSPKEGSTVTDDVSFRGHAHLSRRTVVSATYQRKYFPGGSRRACPTDVTIHTITQNVTSATIIYMRAGQSATMRRHEKKGKTIHRHLKKRNSPSWVTARRNLRWKLQKTRWTLYPSRHHPGFFFTRGSRGLRFVKKKKKRISVWSPSFVRHSHGDTSVSIVYAIVSSRERKSKLRNVTFRLFNDKKRVREHDSNTRYIQLFTNRTIFAYNFSKKSMS